MYNKNSLADTQVVSSALFQHNCPVKGEYRLNHNIKLVLRLVLLLAVMTAIFLFSSQPSDESQKLSDEFLDMLKPVLNILPEEADEGKIIRKLAHFSEFMCMGMASAMFFSELFLYHPKRLLRSAAVSAAMCVLYAFSDEIHQLFVPGRASRLTDVFIDSTGAMLGIALVLAYYMMMKKRKERSSCNGSAFSQ